MAGRITSRQVAAKAKVAGARVVERVRIPRLAANGRLAMLAKRGEGVLIGGAWVVFTDWDRDSVRFTVDAAREIQVFPACPVTLDS
jgi:hypothetical protein